MTQAVDQLVAQITQLSDAEQLQLIAAVLAAAEERGLRPFDDTWLNEIKRRSAEYDSGAVTPIPWSEVKQRARRRIADHG